MILPANSDISGYDGLIYELYFGNVDSASRSNYVAMEANMVNFISYAKSLLKVDNVSLNEETLINNAITAYNAIKQDYKDYGISEEDWKTYVDKVNTAKETVRVLKLKIASLTVQNMQKELDNLEISFDISKFAYLQDLTTRMQALKFDERNLLDLTNYTQVQTMYDAYRESVNDEANQGVEALNHTFAYVASTVAIASAISISIFAIKKIKGIWR
jgi:hypothetical protein